MAIAVTIVGTIAAIIYPMDDITDFLYLIGSVFAPMIAIQIADFFILMTVDIIVGNTLPDMAVTVIICIIVSKFKKAK